MRRQLPGWLTGLIFAFVALAVIGVLGRAQSIRKAAEAEQEPGTSLAEKKIAAPDFTGKTLDGQTFRLSEQKGKVVLINFWATWCGPCRMEMPDLVALQKKYGDKGFTIIGVADDEEARVKAFASEAKLNYPLMIAPDGAMREYGVTGLPTSILVDKNGNVAYAMSGIDTSRSVEEMWSEQIDRVL